MARGNLTFEKLDAFVNKSVKWPFAFAIAGAAAAVLSMAVPAASEPLLFVAGVLMLGTVATAVITCSAMVFGMYKRLSGQWDASGKPTGRTRNRGGGLPTN